MKLDDAINGAIAIGLGWALIAMARNFPEVRHIEFGPGLLPTIVGAGFIIAGTLLIGRRLLTSRGRVEGWVSVGVSGNGRRFEGLAGAALLIAAVLFYVVTVGGLGFLLTMPIVLFCLIWWFDRRVSRAVVTAIAATFVMHVFFYQIMSVPLPWGLLQPVAGALTW